MKTHPIRVEVVVEQLVVTGEISVLEPNNIVVDITHPYDGVSGGLHIHLRSLWRSRIASAHAAFRVVNMRTGNSGEPLQTWEGAKPIGPKLAHANSRALEGAQLKTLPQHI